MFQDFTSNRFEEESEPVKIFKADLPFCILEFLTVVGWITDTYLSDFIQTFSQDITEDLKAASY